MSLPSWAVAEKYEYDLGMSTSCENCGKQLTEGATVWRDKDKQFYQGKPLPTAYYCSTDCVGPVPDCAWCGEPKDDLTEVDDSDPSAGYRSTLLICYDCKYKRRLGIPVHEVAPPLDVVGPWEDFGDEADAQDAGLRPEADHDAP